MNIRSTVNIRLLIKLAFFFSIVLIADILTKYLTQYYISADPYYHFGYPYGGVPIFENWMGIEFSIVHATNRGMAWGLLSSMPHLLLMARIVLIIGMIVYLCKAKLAFKMQLPLVIIIAGALGNVVDAAFYGHVIDMFKFVFWGYHFPVFNFADSAIFCGVSFLFIQSFFERNHE